MKFFLGSDHAGFELKEKIKKKFSAELNIEDLGVHSTDSCDYPDVALELSTRLLASPGSLGLLICGTGVGMSISANKVRGIRAACVSEEQSAKMAREHNDAQILCLGARIIDEEQASKCLRSFLSAKFDSQHERHGRRIKKISEIEDFQLRLSR